MGEVKNLPTEAERELIEAALALHEAIIWAPSCGTPMLTAEPRFIAACQRVWRERLEVAK